MTTYGTIPTSSSQSGPSKNLEYISRAKERIKAGLGTRQPWKLMFNFRSLGLPSKFAEAISRIRTNAAWLFLYFLRDEPLEIFGRVIDDRVVMIVLAVLTVVFLLLTHATVNILVALLIGAVVVVVHAAVRKTDDLFLDEESTGLMTGTGGGGVAGSTS
uniref:PRA1 family protein n=1 Tax=Fagus sylvatica TaxID=28930 RepID=A0A2N9IUE3_FAGSY